METLKTLQNWNQAAEIELIYKTKVKASERPYIGTSKDVYRLALQCWNPDTIEFFEQFKILFLNQSNKVLGVGLRIGEVVSLKNDDVNLEGKYIKVKDGKNHQYRLLPISDSLVDVLDTYLWYKKQLVDNKKNSFFFVKTDGSKVDSWVARSYFKRCLEKSKIYGDDKLRRPRIHDLRHTFAVNALVRIVETGNDVYVALPILSKYL